MRNRYRPIGEENALRRGKCVDTSCQGQKEPVTDHLSEEPFPLPTEYGSTSPLLYHSFLSLVLSYCDEVFVIGPTNLHMKSRTFYHAHYLYYNEFSSGRKHAVDKVGLL